MLALFHSLSEIPELNESGCSFRFEATLSGDFDSDHERYESSYKIESYLTNVKSATSPLYIGDTFENIIKDVENFIKYNVIIPQDYNIAVRLDESNENIIRTYIELCEWIDNFHNGYYIRLISKYDPGLWQVTTLDLDCKRDSNNNYEYYKSELEKIAINIKLLT